ncbi:MAG TPA: hypothetical protein ENJ52_07065 [Aliiroseovarius sp.]|nr:hypothetical protein [Aliiroseovarius sp.]
MIKLGKFFFRTRNWLFPTLALLIYLIASPPPTGLLRDGFALMLMALGVAVRVVVISLQPVSRDGRNKTAHANVLFTEGMFGVCRNPLYLGNLLAVTGFFLLHGSLLVAVLGIGIFAFIYACIILSEEDFLAGRFGDEWKAYRADVPRLMPRLDRLAAVLRAGNFDLGRGLRAESNVISLNVSLAAFAFWYKASVASGSAAPPLITYFLFGMLFAYLWAIRQPRRAS